MYKDMLCIMIVMYKDRLCIRRGYVYAYDRIGYV